MNLISLISIGLTLLCFCITILLENSKKKKKWICKILIISSISIIIFCSYLMYNHWQELRNSNTNIITKDLFIEVKSLDIELKNNTSSEYSGRSIINDIKSSKLESNSTREKFTSNIKDGFLHFKEIPKGEYTLTLILNDDKTYKPKIILKDFEDRWISSVYINTKETIIGNYEIQIVDSNKNYIPDAKISLSTEYGNFDKIYITDSLATYYLNVIVYEEVPLFIKIEKNEKIKTYVITSHKKNGIQYLEI